MTISRPAMTTFRPRRRTGRAGLASINRPIQRMVWRRPPSRPRSRAPQTLLGVGSWAATALGGALVMYFFDPDRGHSRRCRARDRWGGKVRKAERRSTLAMHRRARHLAQRWHGAEHAARAACRARPRDIDDITLAQKIRSEVLGRVVFDAHDVHVDCVHGAAHLRGQVPTNRQLHSLEAAVRRVSGVHRVINDLHLPGTPPPNKAAVIQLRMTSA